MNPAAALKSDGDDYIRLPRSATMASAIFLFHSVAR